MTDGKTKIEINKETKKKFELLCLLDFELSQRNVLNFRITKVAIKNKKVVIFINDLTKVKK